MKNFFKHFLIVLVSVVLVCGILYGTVPDFKNFINTKIFHKSDKKEVVYYPENLYVDDVITTNSGSVLFNNLNEQYKTVRITTPSTKYPATLYLMDNKTKKIKPITTKAVPTVEAYINGNIVVKSTKLIEIYNIEEEKITSSYELRSNGGNVSVFNNKIFVGDQIAGFSLIDINSKEMKSYTTDDSGAALPKNSFFMLCANENIYFAFGKKLYAFNTETEKTSYVCSTSFNNNQPRGVIKISKNEYVFATNTGAYVFDIEKKTERILPSTTNAKNQATIFDGKYVMYHDDYFYMATIDSESDHTCFEVATSDVISTTIRDAISYSNISAPRDPICSPDGLLSYTYGCSEKVSEGVYILDGYIFDFNNKTIKKYSAQ